MLNKLALFADEIDFPEEIDALSNGDGAMLRFALLCVIIVSAFALIAVRVKTCKRADSRATEGQTLPTASPDDEQPEN